MNPKSQTLDQAGVASNPLGHCSMNPKSQTLDQAGVESNPLGHCSIEAYNIWMVADRVEDIELLLPRVMVISRKKVRVGRK